MTVSKAVVILALGGLHDKAGNAMSLAMATVAQLLVPLS